MRTAIAATAVLALTLILVPETAISQENPNYYCGHRCVSNSCIKDAASKPDDVCWFLWGTYPVQCDWKTEASECKDGGGIDPEGSGI